MAEMLLLVDGHALVHRAFHAIPPLTSSKGELVNAVFGFASMLLKGLNDLKPTHVAVAFDKAAPTFRHVEYEAYKATRAPAAEGLHEQFARVREIVQTLGIPIYELDGYEADDVLGTLARQATEQGLPVVIATGDTDALQLVTPNVRVMVPLRGFSESTTYDEEGVQAKYGVRANQFADFKALKGDPSDNIKGVPGVGEKSAVQLLSAFASVEEIVDRAGEIAERLPKLKKLGAVIAEHAEDARKSKWLTTIDRNAPVELDREACRFGGFDRAALVALLRELEFRTLLSKLPEPAVAAPVAAKAGRTQQMNLFGEAEPAAGPASGTARVAALGDYRIVDTLALLAALATDLTLHPRFVVDVETTGVDAMRAALVGISLSVESGSAFYVPVGHHEGDNLSLDLVRKTLGPIFADERVGKVGHNLKYDAIVLRRHDLPLSGLAFDTMLAVYVLESSQRALNLKDVAFAMLGVEMTPITDLIGKGKSQITMAEVEIVDAAAYAGADADMTLRLAELLEPRLRAEGLWNLFADVEMPLVPVLVDIEMAGVALDVPFLKAMSTELGERIAVLEDEIYANAGHRFNIGSTQQLAQVLFNELGLPAARKTKTGYSTDADTLEALRGAHPIIGLILDHRQLVKLKSTYVDALPVLIHPRTGRVHTSFNQTGTTTGRLSSSDPNLQNIPIRTELGRKVRRAFVAGAPEDSLLGADYSQVELRILAHITQDERLVSAFSADEDIHRATAGELFGVPLDQVTSDQRRIAKTTNFGVVYGISDYGLSQQLGISRREAAEFIQRYFARYPAIRGYLDAAVKQAQDTGYVTTLLGRRRYIPEIHVANQALRNAAERMAINMPIQGTAADVIKMAMIRLHRELKARGLRSRMVLQVHDELVLEGPDEELPDLRRLVADVMEHAVDFTVPLKVDVATGKSWADLE